MRKGQYGVCVVRRCVASTGQENRGNSVQFGCIVVGILVQIYGSSGGGHVMYLCESLINGYVWL